MRQKWGRLGLTLILLTGCTTIPSGHPRLPGEPVEVKTYFCRFTEKPPVIDGLLDDPVWKKAQVIPVRYAWTKYRGDRPAEYQPNCQTIVYVLYDRQYLYVGALVDDKDVIADEEAAKARAAGKEPSLLETDVFEVFLQPWPSKPNYFELHLSPLNVTWDARYLARRYGVFAKTVEWESGMKTAVKVDGTLNNLDKDRGYTLEMAIPFSSLTDENNQPVKPGKGDRWKFNFSLYDYSYYNDDGGNNWACFYYTAAKLSWRDFHMRGDFHELIFE
ncbi:MAG: carbohydrate-binding family 9-like protein [Candidatus Omnitrophica bacterium]|nr:carbohydrate-binding family 9-like protein [Candidatus Omnitrophota bacterium]